MASNEYMRKYMKDRYYSLKREVISYLGGKCVKCGSEENLEFDHINPEEKEYNIANMCSINKKDLYNELDKCQLLCHSCHREKTNKEISKQQEGENNSFSKLSVTKVKKIRKLYNTRNYSQRKLGKMFDVSHTTIGYIINRKTWTHV